MDRVNPLTEWRKAQTPPLTQTGLAKRLKVRRETVARWEAGQKPDKDLLPRITEQTGIPAKELRPDLIEKHEEIFGGAS